MGKSVWPNLMRTLTIHVAVFAILLVAGALISLYYLVPHGHSSAEIILPIILCFVLYLAVFSLVQVLMKGKAK
jgi:hypothetical protein